MWSPPSFPCDPSPSLEGSQGWMPRRLLFCESAGPLWILSLPSAQLRLLFRPELHGSPPGPSSVSVAPVDKPSLPSLWPQTGTAQRVGGIYNPMLSSQGRLMSMALHSILFYPLCSEQPLKGPFKGLGMLGRKSKMQVGSRVPSGSPQRRAVQRGRKEDQPENCPRSSFSPLLLPLNVFLPKRKMLRPHFQEQTSA